MSSWLCQNCDRCRAYERWHLKYITIAFASENLTVNPKPDVQKTANAIGQFEYAWRVATCKQRHVACQLIERPFFSAVSFPRRNTEFQFNLNTLKILLFDTCCNFRNNGGNDNYDGISVGRPVCFVLGGRVHCNECRLNLNCTAYSERTDHPIFKIPRNCYDKRINVYTWDN